VFALSWLRKARKAGRGVQSVKSASATRCPNGNPALPAGPRSTFPAHLRPEMSCDSDRDSGERVAVYSVRVAQMCRKGE
jgi:hypothetical protein